MAKQMTLSQVMKQLEAQGDEKVRKRYVRDGSGDNVFGVLLGKIRGLAQALGTNHALGLELWATGNHEARILACMLLDPGALTQKEARGLLEPLSNPTLVDELVGRVLVNAPVAEALQTRWMEGKGELPRRAGWKLLAGRVARGLAKDLDIKATLARILHLPAYTGEAPRPIPKGCTSSYAPEWIAAALALRSGEKTAARTAMEAASAKRTAAPVRKKSAATKAPAPMRAR